MKEIDNKLTQKFDEYPSFGVLKGVKVFVTGTNIAGPFAASIMAEMGAQVIQVEAPNMPCQTRGNYGYSQDHRNTYSITLNNPHRQRARGARKSSSRGRTSGSNPAAPVPMRKTV